MEGHLPEFTDPNPLIIRPGGIDAALIGTRLPDDAPPPIKADDDLIAIGYPAGSHQHAVRHCRAYLRRPGTEAAWIAHITAPEEPVVVGMSGGLVYRRSDAEPVGIITTRNTPADLDRDGDRDQSLDFVALDAVYEAASTQ